MDSMGMLRRLVHQWKESLLLYRRLADREAEYTSERARLNAEVARLERDLAGMQRDRADEDRHLRAAVVDSQAAAERAESRSATSSRWLPICLIDFCQ